MQFGRLPAAALDETARSLAPRRARALTLRRLTGADRAVAEAYLAGAGPEHMFVNARIEASAGTGEIVSGAHVLAAVEGGRIRGLAYWKPGRLAVLARADPDAQRLFAKVLESAPPRGWRMLVAPAADSQEFLSEARRLGAETLMDRPQVFYVLRPADLRPDRGPAPRLAVEEDAEALLRMNEELAEEDLAVPIGSQNRAALQEQITGRIARGECYVAGDVGRPVFQCLISTRSKRFGAQIEGVYTERSARNRGIASSAIAALARELVSGCPFVCLHVAEANAAARKAYEKAGFRPVTSFRLARRKEG